MKFAPGLKLTLHKEYMEYLQGKYINPINIEISPSGICNASCSMCFYKHNHTKIMIDTNILIKNLQGIKCKAISWTGGGEPTLHPDFNKFINEVKVKQGLFTNGLGKINYNPKKLEWIRISKTNKEWNIENLKKLRECKSIGLCINYTGNKNEIFEALEIAYKINIDYVQVRPALNIKGKKTNIAKPKIKDNKLIITDYKFKNAKLNKTYTRCEGYHFVPFIWENGDVMTCAYHFGNNYNKLGNIYITNFNNIMKNATEFKVVQSDCQICCKNNEINELIFDSKKIEDPEFV